VGTLGVRVVLVGILGVGYHFYQQHEKDTQVKREAKLELDRQSTAKVREAEAEFNKFKHPRPVESGRRGFRHRRGDGPGPDL